MARYLIGRVGQAIAVLAVTFTAAFLLLQVLPGDAIMIKFMSPEMGLNADQIAEIRASYGADRPLWQRYLSTVGNFLTGNFGYSIQAGVPVSQQLATNLPPTLLLASLAFVAALVLTIALAALSNVTGMEWLRSLGVKVIDLDSEECASLLREYIRANPAIWNEDIGEV